MAKGNRKNTGNAKTPPKVRYTKSVVNRTKYYFNENVLQSAKSVPHLRKEIQRIFHAANRRIQNIENSGVFSPAVESLHLTDEKSGFSKFSTRGKSWTELKVEYGKAVAFLKQPTSTAQGAAQYEKHLRNQLGVSEKQFEILRKEYRGKRLSKKEKNFVAWYNTKYRDIVTEFQNIANDVADQIEDAATKVENISDYLNAAKDDLDANYMTMPKNELANILDALNDFEF